MSKKLLLAMTGLLLTLNTASAYAASLAKGMKAFEAKDYSTAMNELKPLVSENNLDAMNLVGQMYEFGLGVDANEQEAVKLYNRCSNQGHLECVNSLRAYKDKGYKVELKTVQPNAEAGDATAQNRLGEMYEFGYGLNRDASQAIKWYQLAADQGLVAAQYNLGRAYNFGTGVQQDFALAEKWYRKAAEQGYMDAMFFLGALYSNDHGADANQQTNIIAYAWLQNALELGNRTATAIQSRIVMKLSDTELAEAKTLATEYKEKFVTPFK
ncbi:tetratricopeptide repeat protein [Amphritea sp. 2_MG-2023]|uniref:tetratricopeptide repeat protein n=1 Tax=Amphritea TaxID=515417 RepID=UPI001C07085F|nr:MULTISPECIES: tetratricopeptide repeat protein [Amphritea]MBU2967279.1 sel1 repeat family protein [Amphritea atlantica]MDO6419223.1 tetratricopeptide repeat protein [Amphritea sp. 2_MG-2023]MDX2422946.1 tetratricopeptide repeat protein [Amphritea sp.]